MTPHPVAPGQILAGKYRIENVLGTGAMGMVLAATHLALGTRVAIKVMLGGGARSTEHEERFIREARVAAMLRSHHAGKVLDVGTTEAGAPYIVMELLDGQDLASRLARHGVLPIDEAVDYILHACEAIAEAHGLGIVHRDIKPANLFLTTGVDGVPCIKVVDFGIAKQNESDLALTKTGQTMGSPLYMSPEQMNGSRAIDSRTDIWSLGVTLYELLAGVTPFAAETLMELCALVYLGDPSPMTQFREDVPAGLVAVIMQCLEKDKQRRWPNVAAFATALVPYATARGRVYGERVASVQKVDVPPSRPTDVLPPEPRPAVAPSVLASPIAPARTAVVAASTTAPTMLSALPPAAPPRARALSVAGMVFAIGVPLALFFGLRARSPEPASAATAPPPPTTATATTATATPSAERAEPAAIEPPQPPPTAPAASSAAPVRAPASSSASTARARGTAAPVPRPPPAAKPPDDVLGGSRR